MRRAKQKIVGAPTRKNTTGGLAKLSLLGFVIQGLMNFQADSVALFADMVHQLLDGGENTTSAVVARKARSSQDEKKLRKIGGFISATLIFGASLWILHETLDRLSSLKEISPWWMLAGGFAGLAVGVRQFVKHANAHEEHKNETHWWQYWHLVSDIAGSIAVVAGAVSHMSGYMFGDTAASLLWSELSGFG